MALLAANVLGGGRSTAPGVEAWVVTEGGALQLTAMVVAVVGLGFLEELEVAPGTPVVQFWSLSDNWLFTIKDRCKKVDFQQGHNFRIASIVLDNVLGPARLSRHT